jgi:hypothetical protein
MTRWRPPSSLVYLALAAAFVSAYLAISAAGGPLGFPLDDAWIHQTYARNLGEHLEFAFVPGQPSAGSTSPLWTAILAVGYALGVDYRVWVFGLGALLLAANAWLAHRLVQRLWPGVSAAAWAAGLLVVMEWHLIWSAASGMETLAFSAAVLLVFALDAQRSVWLGVAGGLAVLLRPDGLSLLPFIVLRAAAQPLGPSASLLPEALAHAPTSVRSRALKRGGLALAAFGLLLAAYLLFNLVVGGTPWPNTLYAKQAEYAVLRELPLLTRLLQVSVPPLAGSTVLVLPGLALSLLAYARASTRWEPLVPLAWAAALMLAYALRLPVAYQHGRYLLPIIPVLVSGGVGGSWPLLKFGGPRPLSRIVSRVWLVSVGLVTAVFWLAGAKAYARDVRIIDSEMVAAARWVAGNTKPDALIAAHDIGALGYFADRPLLDLAGLVSPEVIPIIRDEVRLADWLTQQEADYVVSFPGWYAELLASEAADPVFTTGAPYSPAAGGENMIVYRWLGRPP